VVVAAAAAVNRRGGMAAAAPAPAAARMDVSMAAPAPVPAAAAAVDPGAVTHPNVGTVDHSASAGDITPAAAGAGKLEGDGKK
jgi:hypothetical protein